MSAWSGSGSGSPRDGDTRHVQFDAARAEHAERAAHAEHAEHAEHADALDDADDERRAQRNMSVHTHITHTESAPHHRNV